MGCKENVPVWLQFRQLFKLALHSSFKIGEARTRVVFALEYSRFPALGVATIHTTVWTRSESGKPESRFLPSYIPAQVLKINVRKMFKPSGLNLTEESARGFPATLIRASLGDAQWHLPDSERRGS